MRVRPRVKALEKGRRLVWLGHLRVPKVFGGEHYFELEPLGEDRCRFVQGEPFVGWLAFLGHRESIAGKWVVLASVNDFAWVVGTAVLLLGLVLSARNHRGGEGQSAL